MRFQAGRHPRVDTYLTMPRLNHYIQILINPARQHRSAGRVLYDGVALGGAFASGRQVGSLGVGKSADFIALYGSHIDLLDKFGDMILDSFIFAGDDTMVTDVWSAGRHLVAGVRHEGRDETLSRYRNVITSLIERL